MTHAASQARTPALRGVSGPGAPQRPLHLHLLLLLVTGLLAAAACSDPEEDEPASGLCNPTCPLGQLCQAGVCVPIGGTNNANNTNNNPNNSTNNNANNNSNNNSNNGTNNNPNNSTNNNSTNNNSTNNNADPDVGMDADVEIDTPMDTDADDMMDADVEIDTPMDTDADMTDTDVPDVMPDVTPDVPVEFRCEDDDDCSGLLVCDVPSGDCMEPPSGLCASNSDCGEARICVGGSCEEETTFECTSTGRPCPEGETCVGGFCEAFTCGSDADCAPGNHCSAQTYCVECTQDSHCEGSQVCNTDFNQCQEAPADCTTDDDCLGTRVCSGGDCVEAMCPTDPNETEDAPTNNDHNSPTAIQPGAFTAALCGFDFDWYALDVNAGDGLLFQVAYPQGLVTMEVVLENPEREIGRFLDFDRLGAVAAVVERAPEDTTYRVGVSAIGQTFAYDVVATVVPGGFCANDAFEPDGSRMQAITVPVNAPNDRRLCGREEDWFKLHVEAGQTIRATVMTLTGDVPNVEFYAGAGELPSARDTSGASPQTLRQTATEATDYFVRVYSDAPEHETRYSVTLTLQ